jgi:heme exporter protein B
MRVIGTLLWKDVVIEARTRELVTSMSLVAFLALLILSVSITPSPAVAAAVTPAILWIAVAFASTLGLARSHALEQERQALAGLLLTPVGRGTLFLGKCAANLLLIFMLQAVVVAATAVLVDPEVGRHALLLAIPLMLGAVGFAAVGTLFGAMTAATRLREVLLPLLLLPVAFPVIVVSLAGIAAVLDGGGMPALLGPGKLLAAFDIVFVILGTWLYAFVVEE